MSALAATALHASATDVYVYASGNFKPLASLENVRKIINGTTLTTIISTKGDTVKVENAAFDYLTAHPTPVPVGIGNAKVASLKISCESGVVRVVSDSKIRSVSLVSSDGSEFARLEPVSADVALSTAAIPAGVYVVNAVTVDGKRMSKKFIKK